MNSKTAGSVYSTKTHRQLRYGALCFFLLLIVTASVFFIPAQSPDNSSADVAGNYVVSDGIGAYDSLEAAFNAINSNTGTDFTITVYNDDPNVTSFTLKNGKNVTLISSPGKVFELTKTSGRHGTVNGSLTIENIIFSGSGTGGGITVGSTGTFTMSGGAAIQNCYFSGYGGGAVNYGIFNMYDGATIQDCRTGSSAGSGGGLYNTKIFNMYGGTICNNSAVYAGGGIYNSSGGTVNMSGNAVISNNSVANFDPYNSSALGGGICNTSDSVVNISGNAVISHNTVTSSFSDEDYDMACGGGVHNTGRSVLNMSGNAVISDNSVTSSAARVQDRVCGGGVSNIYRSIFTMTDNAVISGNEAIFYGGGVFNWMNSTFTMTGSAQVIGNIVINPAGSYEHYGGGVVNHTATFNMNGNAVISGNESLYGGGVFNIDGTFNMSGNAAVSGNNATLRAGGVYNNNYTPSLKAIFNMSGNAAIYDNTVTAARSNGGGGGMFNGSGAVFNMSGNTAIYNNTVVSANSQFAFGGGVYNYCATISKGEGIVNMSGGAIYNNSASGGGGISNEGIFNMDDGTVSGNTAQQGGGIYNIGTFSMGNVAVSGNTALQGGGVYSSGLFEITDGKISNNSAEYDGGGVFVDANGTFNMYGDSEICGNSSGYDGGGVFNFDTFNMYGGKICGNSGYDGGGVLNFKTFNMYGGKICYNSAERGGGVYNYRYFDMYGGKICDNSANYRGGGVCNIVAGVLNMYNDAAISDNSVIGIYDSALGGGVCNLSGGTLNMSDNAVISGNSINNAKSTYGGGVYNGYGSTFNMSVNAVISGNSLANAPQYTYGGGVYNAHGSIFNMSGNALISDNTAVYGGGVCNFESGSIFNMSGNAVIIGNTAEYYGGGVFNWLRCVFDMSDNAAVIGNTVTAANGYGGGVTNNSAAFSMNGGSSVSGNKAFRGGGVYNTGTFDLIDGTISCNTADYGGGVYNTGTFNVVCGMITDNTANKSDSRGSGGGIYTTDFAGLSVADGVIFSGNKAPALRMKDIAINADIDGNGTPDLDDYANKIGAVRLDTLVDRGQNAPAYNNYDINYPGDTFIVYVDIEPDGAGTVKVSDSGSGTVYGTLTADGYVYVPVTVTSMKLTATPVSGYGFKQFIVNGTPAGSGSPAAVPISGDMSVIAEFVPVTTPPVVTPPGSKDYIITASADDGSAIDPNGTVNVPAGGSRTFSFYPKSGYRITAVYVDGTAITSAEIRSGTYTFHSVMANHTISVVSEAYEERGGGGDGGTIGDEGSGKGKGEWAVLNLVCAIIAVFTGLIAIVAGRDRFKKDNEEERSMAATVIRVLSLAIGIISVVVFFLTEDWSLPVTAIDHWTLLMFCLLVAALIVAKIGFMLDMRYEDKTEILASDN